MSRYTPNDLTGALAPINPELEKIKLAIDDTLSRKNDTPNSMQGNLDMNSQRILNLPAPVAAQEPVRKADFDALEAELESEVDAAVLSANNATSGALAATASATSAASLANQKAQEAEDAILALQVVAIGDFDAGFTITARNEVSLYDDGVAATYYRWDGALPKTVAASSTPAGTGGIGEGAWVDVGQASLRSDLAERVSTKAVIANSFQRESLSGVGLSLTERNPSQVIVSFIDDDGNTELLTKLKPIFDAKGITGGFAVITDRLDNNDPNHISWSDAKTLVSEGWEIMSHLTTGTLNTDIVTAETRLRDSRSAIEAQNLSVESLVPPLAELGTNETKALMRKYYRAYFVTQNDGLQSKPLQQFPINRKDIVTFTGVGNPTLQDLKDVVDLAETNQTWLVFTTHAGYNTFNTEREQVLSDIIDYVQSKNIDIVTPSEALNRVGNLIDIGFSKDFDVFGVNNDEFFKMDATGRVYKQGNIRFELAKGRNFNSPITDFEKSTLTVFRTSSTFTDSPDSINVGIIETIRYVSAGEFGFQRYTPEGTSKTYTRSWNRFTSSWEPWAESTLVIYKNSTDSSVTGNTPITSFELNKTTSTRILSNVAGFPNSLALADTVGVLTTVRKEIGSEVIGYQEYVSTRANEKFYRVWSNSLSVWGSWKSFDVSGVLDITTINGNPNAKEFGIGILSIGSTNAATYSLPETSAGTLMWYSGNTLFGNYQTYHIFRSNKIYMRHWNDTTSAWQPWVLMAGGATGTFTTVDSKTVTVTNGIITGIV
jgi:peptidoglycan/xylan/chitin deacetylase (PgdA/CDA1 family)